MKIIGDKRRPVWFGAGFAAAVCVLGGIAACGANKTTEPYRDAPRGSINDEKADTMTMPDGFSNVAHKCDGPNMVYVIFKSDSAYGSVDVAPNDPRCLATFTPPTTVAGG